MITLCDLSFFNEDKTCNRPIEGSTPNKRKAHWGKGNNYITLTKMNCQSITFWVTFGKRLYRIIDEDGKCYESLVQNIAIYIAANKGRSLG